MKKFVCLILSVVCCLSVCGVGLALPSSNISSSKVSSKSSSSTSSKVSSKKSSKLTSSTSSKSSSTTSSKVSSKSSSSTSSKVSSKSSSSTSSKVSSKKSSKSSSATSSKSSSSKTSDKKGNSKKSTTKKEAEIVFTADLHSHVEAFDTETSTGGKNLGGFARIASFIKEKKEENPDTLVVDAGDFSLGTLYETLYESQATELSLLSKLGVEATTIGNHDLDSGDMALATMLSTAKQKNEERPAMLLSNLDYDASFGVLEGSDDNEKLSENLDLLLLKSALEEYGVENYTVITKDGVKIALFGLLGEEAQSYSDNTKLVFKDPVTSAKETVKKIKKEADPDIIVCLSHSGLSDDKESSEDEILASQVPDIDLIVSGHTHTTLNEAITVGTTTIVATGEYGETVGNISLEQKADKSWKVKNYKLVEMNDSIAEDKQITKLIDKYRKQINSGYLSKYGYTEDQVIGSNSIDNPSLSEMREATEEIPYLNLLADSYIYAAENNNINYKNIISVVPLGTVRSVITQSDNITVSDIFNIFPLNNEQGDTYGASLVCSYLYGSEIKTLADVLVTMSEKGSSYKTAVGGLSYTYNTNRLPMNKVIEVSFLDKDGNKTEINDNNLYPLITDVYTFSKITLVGDYTYGLLDINPKDEKGNSITQVSDAILKDSSGNTVKAWYWLARYIQSFDNAKIPNYYSKVQGRQIVSENIDPITFFKNPNKIGWIVYLVGAIALLILIAILLIIIKLIRRASVKKKLRKQEAQDTLPPKQEAEDIISSIEGLNLELDINNTDKEDIPTEDKNKE